MNIVKIALVASLISMPSYKSGSASAQEISNTVLSRSMVLASSANNIYIFKSISDQFDTDRKQVGVDLIKVLADPKSSNLNQCVAAYFLGEIRYLDSVGTLADLITLQVDPFAIQKKFKVDLDNLKAPAFDALVKIGEPSIPALLHKLQESDDAKATEASLKALFKIDGDRDIVQLRLQKAFGTQLDQTKKARLQLAIKSIMEIPVDK
jgi:hypothetical protein